ncbi:putative ABC transport system permease protein [Paenibacillus endophyticus]|uniref:Putative ABC transport system permease protein n=1 Tax=Paenibacillus endophyticus TaxID=1294268 RepID=A0A7W5C4J4_9BACL|nr:FtsX-like permease family protein [Paenibacillus endophyticus]MBB3150981.1 putative ABC transport system permease protein [Paenibacillus endophyticus]
MALFVMIIRKMVQNKWLVTSLFIGLVLSVALVSSMPIYSEAILSRMLVKDLETMQTKRNVYPGSQYNKLFYTKETPEKMNAIYSKVDRYIHEQAQASFQIPVQELVVDFQSKSMKIRPENDPEPDSKKSLKTMSLRSFSGLEEHIKLIDGRMPAEQQPVDGVYEVLVTERGLIQFKTVLDLAFTVDDDKIAGEIKFKPVGVFQKTLDDDPYFRDTDLSELSGSFIISDKVAKQQLMQEARLPVASVGWFFVLDYSKMELRYVDDFVQTTNKIKNVLLNNVSLYQTVSETPALDTISKYLERADQLRTLMWSLNVPVLIMLGFYMFMVSNLIADRQKNEIAVLRSRGAARWQIITSYAVEGLILCGIAFGIGPLIGVALTGMLGASNGFLEFVQRVRLPIRLTEEAYRYGAISSAACFVIMLIPIIMATRVSIVGHKQQLARLLKSPLWHKMFLDVIALALAIYGLYTFKKRLADLQSLGLNAGDLNIDPLQFVVPALFIMGAGLLLLRLYPWVLRFVYWLGKKWWPPSVYATLIQVGRSSTQYQFLMIFLIMTIATGVFSASAARTINNNTEDRIRYGNGAEVVLTSQWMNDAPPPAGPGQPQAETPAVQAPVHYLEPAFEPFRTLEGVEQAAKVFTKDTTFSVNESTGAATLIGIDTDEFGETTWFRDSLLDYPINDYLNLLAADSQAVLISKTLAEQNKVKPGDTIWVGWSDVPQQPFKVYGIIEYFPTFNPNPAIGSVDVSDESSKGNAPMLIVGHLPRIQVQLALEPYDVWIKLKPETTTAAFYESLKQSKLPVTNIVNTREALVAAKNDPFLMALNGILTLGFVLSILVSFIGFLLYWVLSLRGRTLQNGILRAIGLSLKQLIGMLAVEQLLTSGVAVLIGIAVGNIASRLYVPNFQIAFNPSSLVPPFKVMFDASDLMRIYVLVGFMLVVGLGILAYMLSRLRIHQAIKLGED